MCTISNKHLLEFDISLHLKIRQGPLYGIPKVSIKLCNTVIPMYLMQKDHPVLCI